MGLTFTPLHATFAAQVSDVSLRDLHDEPTLAEIRAGMDRYGVLVFRQQAFENDEQLGFATRLDGTIHRKTGSRAIAANRFGDEGITDISNVGVNDELLDFENRRRLYSLGNRLWHTDASFENPPGRYSMLSARVLPDVAANTEFADTRTAYDRLDDERKARIANLTVHHSIAYSRQVLGFEFGEAEAAMLPGAVHPLVREFSANGRKALYLASHASRIMEWPIPEGRVFLRDLMEHTTSREFVYSHDWQPQDLVIWDNRATMHRATPFDDQKYRRELIRVTTLDVTEHAANVSAA
jgi:alpha-ketoglutarate-dependent 2,4-dichlorophenoxyacetate dioxygenase